MAMSFSSECTASLFQNDSRYKIGRVMVCFIFFSFEDQTHCQGIAAPLLPFYICKEKCEDTSRKNTYSPLVFTSRERSQSALCRMESPKNGIQEWEGHGIGTNVFREPGSPLSFFFLSCSDLCSMVDGITRSNEAKHDNTDSPTTQNTCLLPHNHIPP